jgi:hypothetical protein
MLIAFPEKIIKELFLKMGRRRVMQQLLHNSDAGVHCQ